MKIAVVILTCFLASAATLLAQPSDAEVKQRTMKNGAVEVRFTSPKGTVHTTLTEKWYMRTFESKWKTDYPGIYRWERIEYRYDYVGGKWVFKRSYLNSSWYDGVPNPKKEELIALISTDSSKYLGYPSRMIGKPEFIDLAEDPKWEWHDLKSVSFNTVVVYTEKINDIGDAVKKKETRRVRFYRASADKNTPFTSFISSTEGEPVILEKLKYHVIEEDSPFKRIEKEREEATEEQEEPKFEKFRIGDKVTVNWNNQGKEFYDGEIKKIDSFDENRYFIEFEKIQSVWIHASWIQKK